jgi:hypothetical protein
MDQDKQPQSNKRTVYAPKSEASSKPPAVLSVELDEDGEVEYGPGHIPPTARASLPVTPSPRSEPVSRENSRQRICSPATDRGDSDERSIRHSVQDAPCHLSVLRIGCARLVGTGVARCRSCGLPLLGSTLETLRNIVELPAAQGYHPCECGHPEMRELPDGVFHCPACRSEVLPA